jgi:hypothetical protein
VFNFNLKYFLLTLALFTIEVLIALYVRDNFIRPYLGDFLVVILIYCAVKSVINVAPVKVAIAVLLFSYMIETLQYFHLVDRLGLTHNTFAKTVMGYGFEWWDMLAYTLGIAFVLVVENLLAAKVKRDPAG